MKPLLIAVAAIFLTSSVAFAASTQLDYTGSIVRFFPQMWTVPLVVPSVTASSTATSTLPFLSSTKFAAFTICLTGDCRSSWSTGSGTSTVYLASSSPSWGIGQLAYVTGAGTLAGTSSPVVGFLIATTSSNSSFAGSVGIGSTTPVTALGVVGTTTTQGLRIYGLPGTRALFLDAAGNATSTAASASLLSALSDETGTGVAVFATSPTLTTPIFTTRATTPIIAGGSAVSSNLTLQPTTGVGNGTEYVRVALGNNGATEAMRILSSGSVGIGATNPGSILEIASTSPFVRVRSSRNDDAWAIGDLAMGLEFRSDDSTGSGNAGLRGSINMAQEVTNGTNQAMAFYTGLPSTIAERMRIGSTGLVGIGTTSPNAQLDVRATSSSTLMPFRVSSSTGLSLFEIESNGNVGIGTSSPSAFLTVGGDMRLTGRFADASSSTGSVGQLLMATATGTQWVATSTLGLAGAGTVSSVGLSMPTGFSVAGSPVTTSGTLAVSMAAGYGVPLTASSTQWTTAYDNRITSATSPLAITSNVLAITADGIGDTQLAFNTGQNLTTASSPTFAGVTVGSLTGLIKGASGVLSAATAGTDYQAPITGTLGQAVFMNGTNTVGATTTLYFSPTNQRVGINTTSPLGPLHVVNGNSEAMILEGPAGVVNSAAMKWYAGANEKAAFTWQDTTNFLRMYAVTGSMGLYADNITGRGITILTSSGNTGIGTSTPLSKLDVAGTSGGVIMALLSNTGTKFMEMLNTGVTTLLGAWDFGGATSIEIVNGTASVIDAIGEIAFDTTDNQLIIATSTDANAPAVLPTTVSMGSFLISSSSQPFTAGFASGATIPFKIQRDGYKVTEIYCDVDGGTSIVINFDNGTGNTSSLTCTTTGASLVGVGSNAVVTAGLVSTAIETGTVTGSPNFLRVSVFGTFLRE